MAISSLSYSHFRNLQSATTALSFSRTLNVFMGANAAGKTSLLEALYFLCTGRSFRTRSVEHLLSHDSELSSGSVIVTGGLEPSGLHIGIKKSRLETLIKAGGRYLKSASELATLQPVLVFQPDSFELLSGPPSNRKRFIDWGVFHVEHCFNALWIEYQKCLKQRNTLLRDAKIDPRLYRPWEEKIVATSLQIGVIRRRYFIALIEQYRLLEKELGIETFDLHFEFFEGWPKSVVDCSTTINAEQCLVSALEAADKTAEKENLLRFLDEQRARDLKNKHTMYGAHRCDFKVYSSGKSVKEVLSRGQIKLVTLALFLSSIQVLAKQTERKTTTFLIDDITAELDKENTRKILSLLSRVGTQVFLTALDKQVLEHLDFNVTKYDEAPKLFHVEHGRVAPTLAT